jgi:hypothetical protein
VKNFLFTAKTSPRTGQQIILVEPGGATILAILMMVIAFFFITFLPGNGSADEGRKAGKYIQLTDEQVAEYTKGVQSEKIVIRLPDLSKLGKKAEKTVVAHK